MCTEGKQNARAGHPSKEAGQGTSDNIAAGWLGRREQRNN